MFESMYLYAFCCKVFQLACLFPSARQALVEIIAEGQRHNERQFGVLRAKARWVD